MIDTRTVQKIFDACEITEVVSDYVTLKKRGVNMLGLCPFHNEKTPSFTVSPAKGIYKCFGCGKGGNSVNFIMEHEHVDYVGALKLLANKYHIEVVERELSPEQQKQKNDRESMMIINAYAQEYFTKNLYSSDEGMAVAFSYLNQRGFRENIIKKFQLGYCSDSWSSMSNAIIDAGYKKEYLVSTGLSIDKERGPIDRFKGRIIFPIHGIAGRVTAFGGRIIKNDPKAAKYLNSPESETYHKSRILYGIYQAKKNIVQTDKAYLVEGYTDVLAFHQAGIENVVASSGTALTADQIRLIKRFTNNITIIYDGDAAGIKASLRGIDLILEQGVNVKVLLLPEGQDPDSFSRTMNAVNLIQHINNNETDFIVFKTNLLLDDAKNDPVKKANLIIDIVRSIAIIPDAIVRSVYVRECSVMLNVDERVLHSEINKIIYKTNQNLKIHEAEHPKQITPVTATTASLKVDNICDAEEKEIIRVLMSYSDEVLIIEEDQENNTISVGEFIINELLNDDLLSVNSVYQKVFEEYNQHYKEPNFNVKSFFRDNIDETISQLSADILSDPYQLSGLWAKTNESESERALLQERVPRMVNEYKSKKVKLMLKEVMKKLQKETNAETMKSLMLQYSKIKELDQILAKELGSRLI